MGQLRAPGLGPIVGHTTDRSCRLWVRADPDTDPDGDIDSSRRTLAVVGIFEEGDTVHPEGAVPCYYFRLRREFDRSGTITLGLHTPTPERPRRLKSDTRYRVRIGTLTLDDPIDDELGLGSGDLMDRLPKAKVWEQDLRRLPAEKAEAVFRTFPDPAADEGKLDFLLGSCRYPGLLWKVRHADRIFGPMGNMVWGRDGETKAGKGRKAKAESPPRFTLMVGDQIYADLFNRMVPLGRADSYEEFRERYLTAFGSPNIRRLMRGLPTYMILDDHEIEDNWTQDRIRRGASYQLFTIAIDAYLSYQWSHGPRTYDKRLYYKFDCGSFPFFVVDTRTQRYLEGEAGDLSDNHMLGRPSLPGSPPGQLQRLLRWLVEQQSQRGNTPKFIVTSSVFVPSPMGAREPLDPERKEDSDSWPGFPNTKRALLQCIVENEIQNVVFLSGDIHCANIAELSFAGSPEAEKLRAFSVTSSAFYWPFPFADGEPSDFVHDSSDPEQADSFTVSDSPTITMDYKAWNFTQEDNFCRVSLDRASHSLRVRAYDKKGDIVSEEIDDDDNEIELDETLKLAPW